MARVRALGARGRRFEPCLPDCLPFSQKVIVINTYKITNLVYFPSSFLKIHKSRLKV